MKGLRARIVGSSLWTLGAAFVRYGFDLGVTIVLARLLVPADFGLLAMALVGSRFIAIFGALGLGRALVQLEEIDEVHRSTVFWLSFFMNCVIGLVTAATAPLLAGFYDEPRLIEITWVVALQFPVAGLSTVPRVLLERELEFPRLARLQLWSSALSGAVAIALAALDAGVWSIVVRSVLVVGLTSAALFWMCSWRPRLSLSWAVARSLMGFSIPYYGDQLIKFASRNLDTVLIGRFLGSAPLGLYSRAYTLMSLPIMMASRSLVQVLFAAFSSIQDDAPRVRRIFLQYNGALFLFLCPVMLGAGAVAEPGVLFLLGPEWSDMVPVVQVLAPSGIWQGTTGLVSALYMAKGRTDLQLRYSLLGRGLLLLGIAVGLYWGIVGVAFGFAVGSLLDMTLNLHVAGRLVGLRVSDVVRHDMGVLVAGGLMSAAVMALDRFAPLGEMHVGLRLASLVTVGIIVFVGVVLVLRPKPFTELRSLAQSYRAPQGDGR